MSAAGATATHAARTRAGRRRGVGSPSSRERAPVVDDRRGDEALLMEYSRTSDPELLEALVVRQMPLARKLAARYAGGRESYEDLVQIASCGLVNAIKRFDPGRGLPFAAFATPTILGELRRHFRDRGWAIRVSRGLQELSAAAERAADALTARLGRAPSVREIAEFIHVGEEEILEALEARQAQYARTIDAAPGDGENVAPDVERALAEDDPAFEAVEDRAAIEAVLGRLSGRDRRVLALRFGEDLTQSQIADRVGVSQMHVSRILRSSLGRIRNELEAENLF